MSSATVLVESSKLSWLGLFFTTVKKLNHSCCPKFVKSSSRQTKNINETEHKKTYFVHTFIRTLISASQAQCRKRIARKFPNGCGKSTLHMIFERTCYSIKFLTVIPSKLSFVICQYDQLNACLTKCRLFTICHSDEKDTILPFIFKTWDK